MEVSHENEVSQTNEAKGSDQLVGVGIEGHEIGRPIKVSAMPSPMKMNPVHQDRCKTTQDATLGINLGIEEIQAKVGAFAAQVAAELQAVKEKSELIEEVSGRTAKALLSFHCSLKGKSETRKVVKLGVKAGQGLATMIGVAPRACDNAQCKWARQEATRPCVALTPAQEEGFELIRHKGISSRGHWHRRCVDPTCDVPIQAKKNCPPQRSPPGVALVKAMGLTLPIMTEPLVADGHAAMMAHRGSASRAFQAARGPSRPQPL